MGYTPPYLYVVKGVARWNLYPPSTITGDDLYIYANQIDAKPLIQLLGNAGITLYTASGAYVDIYDLSTYVLSMGYVAASNHFKIESIVANKDLALLTTGTGVLKFGTHTASGDVACNGSIAIKDAAGNARKLMTTA